MSVPVSEEEFPDREFYARQIHFTAADCETLFYLVDESGINDEKKTRLKNKLKGYFVSARTEQVARERVLAARRLSRKSNENI